MFVAEPQVMKDEKPTFSEAEVLAKLDHALSIANAPVRLKGPSLLRVGASVLAGLFKSHSTREEDDPSGR